MRILARLMITFITLCILSIPIEVHANGAKMLEYPSQQGGIFFDATPGVSLIEETISFNIKDINQSMESSADVKVEYNLKNDKDSDQSFKIFFVVPQVSKYKIFYKGEDITSKCIYKEIAMPKNWKPNFSGTIIQPFLRSEMIKNYEERIGLYKSYKKIGGIEIPIDMLKQEKVDLKINYSSTGGFSNYNVKNVVQGQIYYLTPIKFWNGTPTINLKLQLPKEMKVDLYSNYRLNKLSDNYYEGLISGIPDKEWNFSYNDKANLFLGINDARLHAIIIVIIGLGIYRFLVFSYKRGVTKKITPAISYIISIVFVLRFLGKIIDGYVADMFIYMLFILVMVIIIPLVYLYKKTKKRQTKVL